MYHCYQSLNVVKENNIYTKLMSSQCVQWSSQVFMSCGVVTGACFALFLHVSFLVAIFTVACTAYLCRALLWVDHCFACHKYFQFTCSDDLCSSLL